MQPVSISLLEVVQGVEVATYVGLRGLASDGKRERSLLESLSVGRR